MEEAALLHHNYKAKSVWAELNVVVTEGIGKFQITVESDAQLDEWRLVSADGLILLAQGTAHQGYKIDSKVPIAYQEGFQLKVMVHSEGEPKPISVRLSSGNQARPRPGGLERSDELFVSEPSRPFNRLVGDFYRKAVELWNKKDATGALNELEQAQKLDPTHSQVAALKAKILGENQTGGEGDELRLVRKQFEKGNYEVALERVDRIIKMDAGNQAAALLKTQIESKISGGGAPKPKKARSRKAETEKKKEVIDPDLDMADRRALADQAYNLGLESYRKGNWAEAGKFWEEVLRYVPGHAQAKRNLDRLRLEHPEQKL